MTWQIAKRENYEESFMAQSSSNDEGTDRKSGTHLRRSRNQKIRQVGKGMEGRRGSRS